MIELPFRLASPEAPVILIDARLNGVTVSLVLDTGNGKAQPLLVGPSVVERLGLGPAAEGSPFATVRVGRLELGSFSQEGVEAGVIAELDDLSPHVGGAAGNLGFGFLRDWRLIIDYRNSRVRLLRGEPTRNGGTPFVPGLADGFILLPAKVNGRGPYRFLLDTGASASVISPRLADELGLTGQAGEAIGLMFRVAAHAVTLSSLECAGQVLPDVAAGVIDIFGMTSQVAGVQVDGIVGHSFLKEYTVEIDYPAQKLFLER